MWHKGYRVGPIRQAVKASSWLAILVAIPLFAGCASREMVLEMQGSILYEKPAIASIQHTVSDARRDGGHVVVSVQMTADPGLQASFDILPGVVVRQDLRENSAGEYEGAFAIPRDLIGGPYTIIGRVRHDAAGEVTAKDPISLTISLPR